VAARCHGFNSDICKLLCLFDQCHAFSPRSFTTDELGGFAANVKAMEVTLSNSEHRESI
jgi:hypothetical protein